MEKQKIFEKINIFFQTLSLNTGTTAETFTQSRKQDSYRHIWKNSASIHESSSSQFFKTTTRIQPESDTFDIVVPYGSRFHMAFLSNCE